VKNIDLNTKGMCFYWSKTSVHRGYSSQSQKIS